MTIVEMSGNPDYNQLGRNCFHNATKKFIKFYKKYPNCEMCPFSTSIILHLSAPQTLKMMR